MSIANKWKKCLENDTHKQNKLALALPLNPNRLMHLSSNTIKDGLEAVIMQLHDDKWLPVVYVLRAMTSTKTCYVQLEKEVLGIVFACEQFHQYIFGATVWS